ncbi:hypothetical protein JCM11251_001801 [Rhodosporidiobolus azoricus]
MNSSTKLPAFDPNQLKTWLTRHLEPICDAEPAVLADYILALLKHDVSVDELRKLCISQLDDFLDKHTASFVDSLLSHLTSPVPSTSSTSAPPASSRPAPPPNAPAGPSSSSSSKRSAGDAFPSGPSAAKSARVNGGEAAAAARRGEEVEMRDGAATGTGRNGRGREVQPCRDYHFRGFCARGDSCPFAHDSIPPNHPSLQTPPNPSSSSPAPGGPSPFPPGMAVGPNGMPFPFFAAAAAQAAAAQGLPNPFGPGGPGAGGPFSFPGGPGGPGGPGFQGGGGGGAGRGNFPTSGPGFPPRYTGAPGAPSGGPRGPRPARHGSHGQSGGGAPSTAPAKSSRLVLVENIPAQHLTEQSVRHFFGAFGTISGLRVIPPVAPQGGGEEGEVQMKDGSGGGSGRNRDGEKGKAEVFYTHPAAADRAVRSEQAVFGNRFVRVYRVVEDSSPLSVGAPPLAGEGGGVMQVEDDYQPPPAQPGLNPQAAAFSFSASTRPPRAFAPKPRPAAHHQQRNDPNSAPNLATRLSAITTKQKTLFSELETLSSASSSGGGGELGDAEKQRKKAILGVLRTLEKEAGEVKVKLEEAKVKAEGGEEAVAPEDGDEEEDPRAKLARLQAQAASMGLDPSTGQPSQPYPSRQYAPRGRASRGRGRGGGGYQGNANSFRLDNRSTAVVVAGVEGGEGDVQAVREYFEKFGTLTEVSPLSSPPTGSEGKKELTVKFSTRHDAEKALASGTSLTLSSLPYSSTAPFSLRWAGTSAPTGALPSAASSESASNGNAVGIKEEVKMEQVEDGGTREDRRERDEY